jgi:serine/threonine-protein kinase
MKLPGDVDEPAQQGTERWAKTVELLAQSATVRREPTRAWGPAPLEPVAVAAAPAADGSFDARYERRGILGEGGMGQVQLCRDRRMGREVAVKRMLPRHGDDPAARARFIREACIQGQLEHPAVVPVHDLGVGADDRPYFTMKRVGGHSLGTVLEGIERGDAEWRDRYGRRKLLSALADACLALAFAHGRGVVHRDLKPDNIMLGDFGEVHVLDWGVAHVCDGEAGEDAGVAGTPGFIAPEQILGDAPGPDARGDVYALGAILFEILTGEPLHPGQNVREVLMATARGEDRSPAARAPLADVPPELDALCLRATCRAPEERPTARELHDVLERYLEGERDVERRKALAREHAAAARRALDAARGEAEREAARAEALRELGAAVALDPGHEGALLAMSELLLAEAPLSPEAERELEEVALVDRGRAARRIAAAFTVSLALVLAVGLGLGTADATRLGVVVGMLLATVGYFAWLGWKVPRSVTLHTRLSAVVGMAAVASFTLALGPLTLVPMCVLGVGAAGMVQTRADRATRRFIALCGLAAVAGPGVLTAAGLIPSVYAIEPDGIRLVHLFGVGPSLYVPLVFVLNLVAIALFLALMGDAVERLRTAERRLFGQAWRLRQLVPARA